MRASYDDPPRAYHNWGHASNVLELYLGLAGDPTPHGVLAALYHDAVYLPGRSDNESRSADLAEADLQALGIANTGCVRRLILSTAEPNADPGSDDARALVDADLSVLGADPEEYRRYRLAIREEFGSYSDEEWRTGRTNFLRQVLDQPRIYHSEAGSRYESAARRNIETELGEL